jgi:hypothetical protein
LKISVDYDKTYTLDPFLWEVFIKNAMNRGHDVWCVTARAPKHLQDLNDTIGKLLLPDHIIATDGEPKRRFVKDNYDFNIDVWIDDMPDSIVDIRLLRVK